MSKESSPTGILDPRPDASDTGTRSVSDSPRKPFFLKDLSEILPGTPVYANQLVRDEVIELLRRDTLHNLEELRLPPVKRAVKPREPRHVEPAPTPENKEITRKGRLQKALGRIASGLRRPGRVGTPEVVAQPENTRQPLSDVVSRPFVADDMTFDDLDAPEIVFEDEDETSSTSSFVSVDDVTYSLDAESMTFDAPALEETTIFRKSNLSTIHVLTDQERAIAKVDDIPKNVFRGNQIAGSFWTDRNMLNTKKILVAAMLGATVLSNTGSSFLAPVKQIATTQLASEKSVVSAPQHDRLAAPTPAPVAEASAPAAATDIPKSMAVSAPAGAVHAPAPTPTPAPIPVEKAPAPVQTPAKRHQNYGPATTHTPKNRRAIPGPVESTEAQGGHNVYIVTPGAGDPTAAFAVSEYIRQGVIPPGADVRPNMYSAIIAPGMTQNSIQEGADGVKNIIASLPPGTHAIALGFSEGSMANDRANKELTRAGNKRGAKFRDDGAPDAPTDLMRSPQYEMFKPFVQGVLGLQPEELDPDTEVVMNVDSNDVYGTNFNGEWRKIGKNFLGLHNHRIIGANEKPVQIIRKGKVTEKIYGDPQPVPADAQLIEGPYIAPEANPLAPMPAGGDTSAILGPDGNPNPAQPAPEPAPVRDVLSGVPAARPSGPIPESDTPEFFGEQPCPDGKFTPGDAACN